LLVAATCTRCSSEKRIFVVRVMLNGDHVDVMDLEDRRMVATIPTDQVLTRVGIAGDGSRLVAVASAQPTELIFWTLPRPPSVELHTPGPSEPNLARFSRDASRFATTSGPDDQTRIGVWTREGALIRSLSAEGLRGNSFSISADGSRLAVLRGMNRASVWDVESSTFVLDLECSNCGSAVLSPDGSLVLATPIRKKSHSGTSPAESAAGGTRERVTPEEASSRMTELASPGPTISHSSSPRPTQERRW